MLFWIPFVACDSPPAPPVQPSDNVAPDAPTWVVEVFSQPDDTGLDLVVLVDPPLLDSFVDEGLPVLLTAIDDRDYRVGVLSSAVGDGVEGLTTWIDPSTPNPTATIVDFPTAGPFEPLTVALAALDTPGFLREDSAIHVLAVTEAGGAAPSMGMSVSEWHLWFIGLRHDPADRTFSMVGEAGSDPELMALAQDLGHYEDASTPWGTIVDDALSAVFGLLQHVYLAQIPEAETIEVHLVEDPIRMSLDEGIDWTYEASSNSVVLLDLIPAPEQAVEVGYAPSR